jgi:hypothetical protein
MPTMSEVQALKNHAKESIKKSFDIQRKKDVLKKIMNIIEKRWFKQMDHPFYVAALYLNLGKLYACIKDDDGVIVGHLRDYFLDVLARMAEDDETRDKIDAQSRDYELLRGDSFSNKMANQNLELLSPSKCTLTTPT